MVKYDILGFDSEDSYIDYFFETLLPTNQTYDYFVNWEKVKGNVLKCVNEISLLNALTKVKKEEREDKLTEIISKYPEVIPVIPLIIAIRQKNILILDTFKEIDFAMNLQMLDETFDKIISRI